MTFDGTTSSAHSLISSKVVYCINIIGHFLIEFLSFYCFFHVPLAY